MQAAENAMGGKPLPIVKRSSPGMGLRRARPDNPDNTQQESSPEQQSRCLKQVRAWLQVRHLPLAVRLAPGWFIGQVRGLSQFSPALSALGYDRLPFLRDGTNAGWIVPTDFAGVAMLALNVRSVGTFQMHDWQCLNGCTGFASAVDQQRLVDCFKEKE